MAEYLSRDEILKRRETIVTDDYSGNETLDVVAVEEILEVEPADVIPIPEGATNGDVIKAIFDIPDNEIDEGLSTSYIYTNKRVLKGGSQDYLRKRITFCRDWWNAPYTLKRED